ncbi:MAG: response regulator [Pseudomonadota bacterium]
MKNNIAGTILIADDDADDRMLIEDAFIENHIVNPLMFVEDGEQLLQFLCREGEFESLKAEPLPALIILDLNMPKIDGRAALDAIKNNKELRIIPVIVMTTSKAEEDIFRTYDLGVNSFISKPISFDELVEIVSAIGKYWTQVVALPSRLNLPLTDRV